MPYGEFSAKSCYLKSIMTLMEDKRYKLNSEDLNNTYEVCFRIFQYASLFKQQSGQTDSASNHRDNISYHFALACESMGNVCLYDNKDHNDYHADELHSFCTEFNKTIQQYLYKTDGQPIFEWSVINVLKWHLTTRL